MANAIINVGQTGGQVNISTAAAPATPAVGVVTLYAGTDKALHALNSDGTDITIAASSPAVVCYDSAKLAYFTCTASPGNCSNNNNVIIGNGNMSVSGPANGRCNIVAVGTCITSLFDNGVTSNPSIFIGRCLTGNGGALNIGFNQSVQGDQTLGIGFCNVSSNFGQSIGTSNNSNGGFAIGSSNVASFGSMVLGCSNNGGSCSAILGNSNNATTNDSIAIGRCNVSSASNTINIGVSTRAFPGATGTIVLGNSSVGGTGACNSIVLGNSSRTTAACGISIGNNIINEQANSIVIGSCNSSIICAGTPGTANIIIGTQSSCITGAYDNNSIIGSQLSIIGPASYRTHLLGGYGNNACADHSSIISGSENCIKNGYYSNILGGQSNKIGYSDYGRFSTIISSIGSCYTGGQGPNVILGGCLNTISSSERFNNIFGGCSNTIGSAFCNVTIIGNKSTTAAKSDTVYVPSLIATGQAASLAHAVGSTGGAVAINWDNSNVQTLTLTSSATVSMSNPIDGGVYTLQITQGGAGSYTATWSNIKWPGGTPPTLSTAVGALDVLTFIYGPTAYVGNANLNFS